MKCVENAETSVTATGAGGETKMSPKLLSAQAGSSSEKSELVLAMEILFSQQGFGWMPAFSHFLVEWQACAGCATCLFLAQQPPEGSNSDERTVPCP
jgi:hypothetical protein